MHQGYLLPEPEGLKFVPAFAAKSSMETCHVISMRSVLFFILAGLLLVASPHLQAGPLGDGLRAFEAGDYQRALALWKPLAEKNDPDALYNIGLLYMKGLGVKQDYRAAKQWFKQAAKYGSVDAAYNLGVMYKQRRFGYPSSKDALYWWRQAAERGHPESMFNLGVMLAYGNGTKKDVPAALELWQKAAAKGNRNAIETLIKVYEQGLLGITPDPQRAQYWRKRMPR